MSAARNRKKRVSKKLKSSWRKHVKITDVEEFLEEKRLDERLGPTDTLTNDELFKVDVNASLELLSAKERRKLKATKPLKCFSMLQPHSKVPDPITKRNRVRTKEERRNHLVKLKELNNKEKGILKAKEILALKNRQLDDERRKNQPKRGEFNQDLWAQDEVKKLGVENEEWLNTNTVKHNLRGCGTPVENIRKSIKIKPSVLPPIETPHPGMSYNPSFADHQDLLRIVAEKETKLIKEEAHLNRCTTGMFEKVPSAERDENWIIEMSEGLPSKEGAHNAEDDNTSDNEYTTVNPPVENKKKSQKQRRKQREQLELEKAKRALKLEKKKVTDIHQIKHLQKQIDKIEEKQKKMNEKKKKRKELKKNKVKMLGPMKFEDPDLEFQRGQELSGNLKNLKAQGNILMDRFKSMQKRNILAPTVRRVFKKPKVKKYVKPGHRDEDWKKTICRQF